MANFSSFFPSAGGGGGGIGQTITVGDYSYPNAISLTDFVNLQQTLSNNTNNSTVVMRHPSSSSPTSYVVSSAAHDTYENLVNITSATNGGALYFLGSEFRNGTPRTVNCAWRVTIDGGTAVEITNPSFTTEAVCTMMGQGWQNFATNSGSTKFNMEPLRGSIINETALRPLSHNYASGKYYLETNSSSLRSNIFVHTAEDCATFGAAYVYFSTSLLIEFKTVESSVYNDGKGVAIVKTF